MRLHMWQVFRTLAVRDELLRAMLNADLIGFLLFEFTRNFLTCCKRRGVRIEPEGWLQ